MSFERLNKFQLDKFQQNNVVAGMGPLMLNQTTYVKCTQYSQDGKNCDQNIETSNDEGKVLSSETITYKCSSSSLYSAY